MKTTKTQTTYGDIRDTVKCYLEEGLLERDVLNECGISETPKIKMVWMTRNGDVRLLVYGECPCCKVRHVRNICNVRYINNAVKRILKSKFDKVNKVYTVLTHDVDFDRCVINVGGTVELASETEDRMRFFDMKTFFLTKHPDIDAYVKYMTLRDKVNDGVDFSSDELVSFDEVHRKYFCSWAMLDTSVVMTDDGTTLEGTEIQRGIAMSKFENLPFGLFNTTVLGLRQTGAIRKTDYKVITMN